MKDQRIYYSCKNKNSRGSGHICVSTAEIFGVVRSLMAFRLTGGGKDFLIVGSDSGRIAILEYNASKNTLERVHMETFGKSGCRRIVPGQYLAIDPKGRAGRSWTLHMLLCCFLCNTWDQIQYMYHHS